VTAPESKAPPKAAAIKPRARDAAALEEAFAQYQAELLGTLFYLVGNMEDARDALQEAFVKCWRSHEKLVEVQNLKAWIFRIALNTGRDIRETLIFGQNYAGGIPLDPAAAIAALPDDAEICGCNGVSKGKVTATIAGGATTLDALRASCKASASCGSCTGLVEQLLKLSLGESYGGERSVSTCIYYLLTPETYSAIHCVKSDEIFHFYAGDLVEMLQLWPDGSERVVIIHNDLSKNCEPQVVVPAGVWQGCRLVSGGNWALMGCTVAPGFDYADFELAVDSDDATGCDRNPRLDEFLEALQRHVHRVRSAGDVTDRISPG